MTPLGLVWTFGTLGFVLGVIVGLAIAPHLPSTLAKEVSTMRRAILRWIDRHAPAVTLATVLVVTLLGVAGYVGYTEQSDRSAATVADLRNANTQLREVVGKVKADEAATKARQKCQTQINRDLLTVLHARSDPFRNAVLAPRAFFRVLYPDLKAAIAKKPPTGQLTKSEYRARQRLLTRLTAANRRANRDYNAYIRAQKSHPLPPVLSQLCHEGGGR